MRPDGVVKADPLANDTFGGEAVGQVVQNPIVTEIAPLSTFYEAEAYHQNYYRLNPKQPYCMMVIDPKMRKFKKEFEDKLKS